MPNIKTFDAGEGKITPSEAGSAAYRELGAVQERNAGLQEKYLAQAGHSIGQGISAIGEGLGEFQAQAQQHTDALAEIDFQNQLTQAEIAAQGGIVGAGTPRSAEGAPISDHPGVGVDKAFPQDAQVPSPGQYATSASDIIDNHSSFLDRLIGGITGQNVSQKARDRMALQAAVSNRRLAVSAAAIDGQVAVNHAIHTTDGTVNETIAATGRGDLTLPDAMDHIDGAFDAVTRTFTGAVGAKGTLVVDQKRDQAKLQVLQQSMYNDVVAGHTENALRTLNDSRWDSIVGGQRPKLEEAIRKFSNERIQDQDRLDKHQQNLDAIARDKDIGDLYTNSLLPKTDPKYVADPLDAINKKYQGDDLINARKEFNQLVTGPTQHQTDISRATFSDLASRVNLPYGDPNKITNLDEIRQARQKAPGTPGSLSRADSNELTNMITRQSTPEGDRLNTDTEKFLDSRKGFISKSNPLMGKLDPSGDAQVYDYRMAIRDKQQQLLQRGDDPRKAITPGNPDYMGSPENMQRFQTPISQSVKNLSDRLRQGQPGTQPGGTQTQQPTGPPSGTPAAKIPGVLRSPSTGMYQDPKTKQIYGTDGYPQKMNFSPEGGGSEGQNAINNAMGVDAHNDKNFFSSGRAEQAGIDGGIGENLKTITTQGQTVQVNAAAAPHFQGFLDELERKGYKVDDIGGYSNRMKRGSFTSMSEHAFGNAIDINPDKNPFHSAKDNLPKDVAQIAARYGLIWGGDWNGRSRDPMHFEWSGKGGSSVTASR